MSCHREQPPADELFDALFAFTRSVPWWLGLAIVPMAYVLLRWAIPGTLGLVFAGDETGIGAGVAAVIGPMCVTVAPWAAGLAALIWIAGQVAKGRDRWLVNSQTGIDSIRKLDWRTFEDLLAAAFRQQGYRVEPTPRGADGGVDLRLWSNGKSGIVQAKQWRRQSVGVKPVRELRGVGASESAAEMIFVTSGRFTREARAFGDANGMTLIDGDALARMIASVQRSKAAANPEPPVEEPEPALISAAPACPACGSPMVQRTARKGPSVGQAFWGCSTFPNCRGTRPIE